MKTRNLLVILFTLLITSTLNAAVTIKKVWQPGDSTLISGESAQYSQLMVESDDATGIETVRVLVQGVAANAIFKSVSSKNGYGRTIGKGVPMEGSSVVDIAYERTVLLPKDVLFLSFEGEVSPFATKVWGAKVNLVVQEVIMTDGRHFSVPEAIGTGATHRVPLESSAVGWIELVEKFGESTSVFPGESRFLGGFVVLTGGENMSALPNIGIHLSGGSEADIRNLQAVVMTTDGKYLLTRLFRYQEPDNKKDDNYLGSYVNFSSGTRCYIGIFGDVGESFGSGTGVVAVSTNPSLWRSPYGYTSGKVPALLNRTIVGPTIRILQSGTKG